MNVRIDDEEHGDFEQEGYSWECEESTTGTLGTHEEIQQSHHVLACCFVGMS